MHHFTGRRRPRRGGAAVWRPPSPVGTSSSARGRPAPPGERARGRRRTPRRLSVRGSTINGQARCFGETHQLRVADQFPSEPEEGLLEVVVGLGRDIVVLKVLLAVESDGLGLDLALLHIDLVTAKHDGDVLADTDEVT